jgi:hypothetical protein
LKGYAIQEDIFGKTNALLKRVKLPLSAHQRVKVLTDPFTEEFLLMAGIGTEITEVATALPVMARELRLKTQQIAHFENQISKNQSRNDFTLSEIVRINEISTVILLNTLWTLTNDPQN